jgi:hypothetical protein
MTGRVRQSSLILLVLFAVLFVVLVLLRDVLYQAHINELILHFSSDGSIYFNHYERGYHDVDVLENWTVFLRGSPILFMMLTDGNLFAIQAANLLLMAVSMKVAFDCFTTFNGRMTFLFFSMIFPYFAFGFLGLNKEVYAMCATMFYGSYMIRGRLWHLAVAILLALCARYYMVASFLMLFFAVPRAAKPRWLLIVSGLVAISLVAPLIKDVVPEYSSENLLEGSGGLSKLMSTFVERYGYALLYPIKYLVLPMLRPFGYVIGAHQDAIGAIVSIWSLIIFSIAGWMWMSGKQMSPIVRRLIVAGFVAPIPMMWSEISHWRYYSFVYFFFLYALVLHSENKRAVGSRAEAVVPIAPAEATPAS